MSTTWDLGGNKGTNPPKDFLGTGDSEPLVIMTNGVEKLRIDSAGNVGIGTTNPMQQLQVTGQGFFTGSGASPDPGDSSETGIRIGYQSTDDYGYINANTTGVAAKSLVLQQNGGNVGIGTSTPGRRLTLVGGADLALRLQDSSVPTGPFWELQPSAFLSDHFGIVRYEGAAQESKSLVIAPDGHFGIGTASPNCKLTVSGAETTLHGGGAAIQLTNSASGGTNWYLSVGATGTATPVGGFAIANDERFCLSITRDGNIIVGRDIMLTGADCAEEFDMAEATEIEPGTVDQA